jgi:hypothetical protein
MKPLALTRNDKEPIVTVKKWAKKAVRTIG